MLRHISECENETEENKLKEKRAKYVCSICGYEYTGDIPFEDLPEDYVCPVCGQPKSVFVKKEIRHNILWVF